ncbi:hypothetical protein ALC57_14912 [Trachymyrmex cornetzi]|uniref:Uncharacterized protein n=1 Tax=Trachymyrmex cornetzi TaxID=471704 RepID=A0A195DJ50_9HYME|nr:hypothetical protein ALC57_14912 [Trachymyrmex cornetzi]
MIADNINAMRPVIKAFPARSAMKFGILTCFNILVAAQAKLCKCLFVEASCSFKSFRIEKFDGDRMAVKITANFVNQISIQSFLNIIREIPRQIGNYFRSWNISGTILFDHRYTRKDTTSNLRHVALYDFPQFSLFKLDDRFSGASSTNCLVVRLSISALAHPERKSTRRSRWQRDN